MKSYRMIFTLGLISFLFAGVAQASMVKQREQSPILFEVTKNELIPATEVGDSVFYYEPEELICGPNADQETPCLATVDHWETICFKGDLEDVCPAFEKLFNASSEQLLESGAEEDVELLNCSSETGITILSFNLISYHGGPNVLIGDKLIPMCPIFFN